jgi:hypothetical protein
MHAFGKYESTQYQYLFEREDMAAIWKLLPSTTPARSAVHHFRRELCTEGCWICRIIKDTENLDDLEHMISCWQDINEEEYDDQMAMLMPWSGADDDFIYQLI